MMIGGDSGHQRPFYWPDGSLGLGGGWTAEIKRLIVPRTQEQPLRADAVLTKSQENFQESVLGRRKPLWSSSEYVLWGAPLEPTSLVGNCWSQLE